MKLNCDMKKRTFLIGSILTIIPIGQPIFLGTAFLLTSAAAIHSLSVLDINSKDTVMSYNVFLYPGKLDSFYTRLDIKALKNLGQ